MPPRQPPDSFPCPHCGEPVSAAARFCRQCGADDEVGWAPDESTEGYAAEDDDFDYDEYIAREFPDHVASRSPHNRKRLVATAVVIIVCLSFLAAMIVW